MKSLREPFKKQKQLITRVRETLINTVISLFIPWLLEQALVYFQLPILDQWTLLTLQALLTIITPVCIVKWLMQVVNAMKKWLEQLE